MTPEKLNELWRAACPLWEEDDCAPDAERLGAALERIFGKYRRFDPKEAIYSVDEGDGELRLYEHSHRWVFVFASYPGNNYIRVLRRPENAKALLAETEKEWRYGVGKHKPDGSVGMIAGPFETINEARMESYYGSDENIGIYELPSGRKIAKWRGGRWVFGKGESKA